MSNPTSNFGWQMPTPTDLVTDLPADFEVFGQAVDSDLADLNGGTTGQILSKTSNTDLDFTWITSSGDIEGVTAGVGITGGGTTGTVTITNNMATTITASGDIVVGTGSGTYDNLPIGTTGQILTADTTVSPYKVKWAAPAGGGANWSLLNAGGTPLTGASTITVSGISGKDRILMLIEDASAGANSLLQIRLNGDTAANYGMGAGSVDYPASYSANMSGSVGNASGLDGISFSNLSSNATSTAAGYIEWSGCNAAGVKMCTYASGTSAAGGNNQNNYYGGGVYTGSSTISSISIFSNSGNFDAGNIYVYAT
jgi:hypothetical protein